jgi:hypothetical protein
MFETSVRDKTNKEKSIPIGAMSLDFASETTLVISNIGGLARWDLNSGDVLTTQISSRSPHVKCQPKGRLVAVVDEYGVVTVYDVCTLRALVTRKPGITGSPTRTHIDFARAGDWLICGCEQTIAVLDSSRWDTLLTERIAGLGRITALCCDQRGTTVFVGTDTGAVAWKVLKD